MGGALTPTKFSWAEDQQLGFCVQKSFTLKVKTAVIYAIRRKQNTSSHNREKRIVPIVLGLIFLMESVGTYCSTGTFVMMHIVLHALIKTLSLSVHVCVCARVCMERAA